MEKRKYSVFLGNLGTCNERHCQTYSHRKFSVEELFSRAGEIELISGVDLVADSQLVTETSKIKSFLRENKLSAASIVVDLFGNPMWKQGSFSSTIAEIRDEAVSLSKKVKDMAEELGCEFITIWPGQDGWDYHFQSDYLQERTWFADGIREICKYKPQIGVALEYKLREPRTHNYINTVGNTILTVIETGQKNCGIAFDLGHGLFNYENPAESVALMHKWGGNLMHIHINDNFAFNDDDLIVGSVHTLAYLEFIYWLRKTGYNGWFTVDIFPYREDGKEAVEECVKWLDCFERVIDKANYNEIELTIKQKDAILANKLMRKLLFG